VESASRTVIQVIAADLIAPVVLVNGSAGVAKNFCALELATTSALQVIFCLALLLKFLFHSITPISCSR
jgi:hypothetical protein